MRILTFLAPLFLGFAHVQAALPKRPSVSSKVGFGVELVSTDKNGSALPPINTTYYFDQLIDHNNPSKGTFKQRYWASWADYEPGGPIVLFTPGEENADGV